MSTQDIPISSIVWLPEYNMSRRGDIADWYSGIKDRNEVINALVHIGWSAKHGVAGVASIDPAAQAELQKHVEYQKIRLAALIDENESVEVEVIIGEDNGKSLAKHTINFSSADRREMFTRMFCDKKGKVITPSYSGVWAFRRAHTLIDINVVRGKLGMEPILEIPCTLVVLEGDENARHQQRAILCLEENEGKGNAILPTTLEQKAIAIFHYVFQMGNALQVHTHRALGGTPSSYGMAQKLHKLFELDSKFPKLELMAKIEDKSYKLLSSLSKEAMRKLLQENASFEEVAKYISNPKKGNNKEKVMGRPTVESCVKGIPNPILNCAFLAVLKNDKSFYTTLCHPDVITKVQEVVLNGIKTVFTEAGKEEEFNQWLTQVTDARNALLSK